MLRWHADLIDARVAVWAAGPGRAGVSFSVSSSPALYDTKRVRNVCDIIWRRRSFSDSSSWSSSSVAANPHAAPSSIDRPPPSGCSLG